MKKKILALLLMVALAVGVTACGNISDNRVSDDVEEDFDEDEEDNEIDEDADEEDVKDEVAKSEGVLTFDVPEGLVYNEEKNQYVSMDANEVANINYLTNPNDGSFASTTKEIMEEALESTLSSTYGETIDLVFTKWDVIKVDGYDAISYQMEYMYSGMKVIQAQVIVDGTEKLHFVTFTYLEHEDYADKFAACIDSFRFE